MEFTVNGAGYSLDPTSARSALRGGAPDDVREHWVEVDGVRWPPKLLTKISYLASGLGSGDFGPTKQQREVQALLKQQLGAVRQRLDGVLSQDLPTFNKLLADSNSNTVIKPVP